MATSFRLVGCALLFSCTQAIRPERLVLLQEDPAGSVLAEVKDVTWAAMGGPQVAALSAFAILTFGLCWARRAGPSTGRVFAPSDARGGCAVTANNTALLMIEFQNEFTTEGGKLHDSVKECMESTNMLENAAKACEAARAQGCKIFHIGISFAPGKSDNPNPGVGILKGCADGELFLAGTWNSDFHESMKPKKGDIVVKGKRGLDSFPGTNLESLLIENRIHHVAIGGFLSNCCVESTMRTAFECGFNVFTLTDCCATNSMEGQKAATEGTFGMFSTPITSTEFLATVKKGWGDDVPMKASGLDKRVFAPADAKGGCDIVAAKTAILMIECQNEFASEGGKLHDGVKEVMASNEMLKKAAKVCATGREKGCKVIMCPITFAADNSDNPNKGLGILKGCADGGLFTSGTWNADFHDSMKPQGGDLVVIGKKGLDAFPGTNLEKILVDNGIETVAFGGFLTNCCVESTIRTANEKGFNCVSLTDCSATTSQDGQDGATGGTWNFFSTPMTSKEFVTAIS